MRDVSRALCSQACLQSIFSKGSRIQGELCQVWKIKVLDIRNSKGRLLGMGSLVGKLDCKATMPKHTSFAAHDQQEESADL